jgi:hypothetical protein
MEAILVILFIVLVAAGAAVYLKGRDRERVGGGSQRGGAGGAAGGPAGLGAGRGPAPARSDIRALRVGDVVNHDGGDFIVEGTLRLEQGGYRWEEHRLVDGPRSLWLSVEDDEGLEVVVWDRGRGITLEPGPSTLTHDGVTYELDERGQASFTAEGSTATAPSGRVEYADYEAGERRLSFERFGDDTSWEVGVGTVVSEHALDVYPGRDA